MPFPAAPLDVGSRIVTALIWSLAGMGAVLAVAALLRGDGGPALGGAAVAVVVGGLAAALRRIEPTGYDVAPDGLVVHRRAAADRRFAGPVALVDARRPFHVRDLRLLGSGGLYGYLGIFTLHGIGRVRAFVTNPRFGVVVDAGGRRVHVSPRDPAAFAAALGPVLGGGADA